MPPDARGMWTPRQTTKKFPLRVAAPKIRYPYKPPKPPKKRMTIKEAMTIEGAEVLAGMARSWLEEADRIERETPEPTFEQKIGDYLLQQNVRIDALMRSWDDVLADGSIVKGEFRIKLRQLKPDATSAEIDQLFDSYDEDGGGAIDAVEMKGAFLRLKEQAKQARHEVMGPREKAERLRERAAAAQEASKAVAEAEQLEEELEVLKKALDGTLEVQLGLVLHRKKIRVGEVVGTWAVTKRNELTRQEFRDNVRTLLPPQPGSPRGLYAAPEIDALFEKIDDDKNGTIDFNEARYMLKGLQETAAKAIADRDAKASHAAKIRRRASRKTQAALNPESLDKTLDGISSVPLPPSPGSGDESEDGAGDAEAATSRMMGLFGGMFSEDRRLAREKEEERKKRAAYRAQQALKKMMQRNLAVGWNTWIQWHEHRTWQLQCIRQALGRIQNGEVYRALSTWHEFGLERARRMGLIRDVMKAVVSHELKRGYHGWTDLIESNADRQRIAEIQKRAMNQLKNPTLLGFWTFWKAENREKARAREDWANAGINPVQQLCITLGLRKCAGV